MGKLEMHDGAPLIATVHGRFLIETADGAEVALKGAKERALMAMLVLSPGQSRPRSWLQDRLWSQSPPDRGAVSLRRVLSNIRRALGPHAACFYTNRSTVSLRPEIGIASDPPAGAALLEDVDGQDPEFDFWLTSMLAHEAEVLADPEGSVEAPWIRKKARQVARIRVESNLLRQSRTASFAAEGLASRIASRLQSLGPVEIELDWDAPPSDPQAQPANGADTLIRIQGTQLGERMQFNARIQRLPGLQFCGSHRALVPASEISLPNGEELAGLVNRTVMTVLDVNAPMGRSRPYYAIQNAVRRIYAGDQEGLAAAESLLLSAQEGSAAGIALAWRAFLRYTEFVEFRQDEPSLGVEAVEMSEAATRMSPRNSIVWALASQIAIYLTGDHDRGAYYARRAAECSEDDPYTLDAQASAAGLTNDREKAFELAEIGRRAAEGMDNVYNWDMQCCISALCVDRLEDARRYAQDCHWQMPQYRPALRYLVALNLLVGDRAAAETFSARLKKLEPGFDFLTMVQDHYPINTLRKLGRMPDLKAALVA